jgi:hypothetical protein
MSVSSVNSGTSPTDTTLYNIVPQRGARQDLPIEATDSANVSEQTAKSTVTHLGMSAPLFNLTGVAAYSAIMDPQPTTSMRIEA